MNSVQLRDRARQILRSLEAAHPGRRREAKLQLDREAAVLLRGLQDLLDAEIERRIDLEDRLRDLEAANEGPSCPACKVGPNEPCRHVGRGVGGALKRAHEAQSTSPCPDPKCPNCRKCRAWEARHDDVEWGACPTCQAGVGEPCRHVGRGAGRGYAPVLMRPHRGRPGELRGKGAA